MQTAVEFTPQPVLPILQRYRIWRWVAICAQMVMELCWIIPWYRSLTPTTFAASEARVFWVFLLVMLIQYGLAWAMNVASFKLIVRRVFLGASLVVSIFFAYRYLLYYQQAMSPGELLERPFKAVAELLLLIPNEFIVALFVILIGLRGVSIASQSVSPSAMVWRFQIGVGMFILFAFVNTMVTGETPGNVFPTFLFSGLIAMSASRLAILERLRGGRPVIFDRRWFLGILIACSLAVLVALVAGNLVYLPVSGTFTELLNSVLLVLFVMILLLLAPILFVLLLTFIRVNQMLAETNAFPELVTNLDNIITYAGGLADQLVRILEQSLPPIETLRLIFLWGTVAFVLFVGLVLAGLTWVHRSKTTTGQDEIEKLENSILGQIKKLLRSSVVNITQVIQDQFRGKASRKVRQRIRRIYQEMLLLSLSLGARLPPYQTPLELIPVLTELFQPLDDDVHLITEAYLRVRYGELSEKDEDLVAIENASLRIMTLGKKLKAKA